MANNKAASGGLVKDASGHFIWGFVASLGSCPITVAELLGIVHAIEMAWSSEHTYVIVEVDSFCAIQLIQKPLDFRHPYAQVIEALLNRNWVVRLEHIY